MVYLFFVVFFRAENLYMRDALIEICLAEKHRLFASIATLVTGFEEYSPSERRLLCGNSAEPQQGEHLLSGALKDGETRTVKKNILHCKVYTKVLQSLCCDLFIYFPQWGFYSSCC